MLIEKRPPPEDRFWTFLKRSSKEEFLMSEVPLYMWVGPAEVCVLVGEFLLISPRQVQTGVPHF